MSITVKRNNRLPLLGGKLKNGGNLVCPPLKKTLMPRPADNFNNKKVRNEDVQLVLKFLRECFDFAPTITPADTVCKLRLKMSSADHKIKRMKDQLLDHDVLLFDVQEELNLGPETNPVRTARAFKTYVRASKERATRLEKIIKGNETVLKVCKEIAGVSGQLAPDGLADLLNSTWSKQRHVITQLKNNIQNQKEQGPILPRKDSLVGQPDESLLMGLARIMDVDTNDSHISTVVGKMKITFMDMKNDVISLKDTVKVKEDTVQELRTRSRLQPLKPLVTSRDESEIQNLRDREKTKTKRIVELQNELEDVKTKNLDLAHDLQEAQDQRQTADNRVFDFESKIRDLEVDIEKKACEIEDLLQRYEEAGEVVSSLQTELDQTKQNNDFQNAEIKTLQSREFKKDDLILKLEKELANFQQKMESDSKLENLRSNGYQRDDQVLKLERDIANMQREKDELYQQIQNSFSKDYQTSHHDQVLKLKQEVENLKEQKIELELKLKDAISRSDAEIFELNQTVSDVQEQKIELDSKLKDVGEKFSDATYRSIQLEKDVADLQSKHSEVDTENQRLSKLISEYEADIEQLVSEKEQLKSHYEDVGGKYSDATHRIIQLERDVADLQSKKIDEVDSENQRLSKLISEYEADMKQLVLAKEQLKTHYEGMIDRRFEKLAAAEQHANQKSRDLANAVYQKLAGRMKVQLREQLTELKAKKAKETEQPTEEIKITQSDKSLGKEIEATPADNTARDSHPMPVPQDLSSKDQNPNENVPDVAQKKEQLEVLVHSLTKEKDRLSAQLQEARQEYQVLEDQFESVNEEGEKHQALAQQVSQEKEEISKQLEEVLQQCKELEENQEKDPRQTDDLSAQVMKAQQQYQELKERFATELEEVTKARQELTESAAKERDDLKAELAEARQRYEETHEKMLCFQKIGDDIGEHNYKISAEIGMASKDYKELDDKFRAAKEESEKQVTQLQEENDYVLSELVSLRNQYKELVDDYKAAKEESEKEVTELQEENDCLLSDLTSLRPLCQEMNEKFKATKEENEKKVTELQEENDYLSSDLASLRPLCQNLQESLQCMTDRNEELNEELNEEVSKQQKHDDELYDELENSLQQCQDLEDELERETLEFQEKLAKLEKEKANLLKQLVESRQSTCQEVNSRPAENPGSTKKLEEQITDLQKESKDLQEKLQTAEIERKDLKEKSARATLEFKEKSGKLEKEKANLLKQLEGRQIVCQQFEEYLAAATEENERHMTLAAKLKDENDDLSRQLAHGSKQSQRVSNPSPSVILKKTEKPEEQIEELQNRKNELEKKLNKAENECSIMTMRNQTATRKVRELERLLKEARENINKLETEIKETNSRPTENPGSTKKLEEQIAELQKERKELEEKLQTAETECKLTKKKVETAFSMTHDYKADIADMKVHHRGLQNQVDFQKKKNEDLEGQISKMKKRNDLLEGKLAEAETGEKETEELKEKESEIKELGDHLHKMIDREEILENEKKELESEIKEMGDHLMKMIDKVEILEKKELEGKVSKMKELQVKLTEAETRENETENELQAIRATLTTAAFQFGLLTKVGDELTITDLCQSLDDMRQLNAHMRLEINDLEKAKANLEDMLKTGDCFLDSGDSGEDKSAGEREKYALKATVEDLRFQTYKQEHMIKKLRYQVSEFHQYVLKKKDAMFDDMPYIDRAVVMCIYPEVGLKTVNAADLSFLPEGQVDDDEGEIGKGAFGKVFLRQYRDEAVAVKVPYISERVRDEDAEKRMMRIKANHARTTMEYVVHVALAHHPSFPKTVGIVDYDGAPSLVLEFLGDKETSAVFSLSQAIKYPSPSLRRGDWFGIIMDIVDGMKTMHVKGLLHNDLKPNNVLLQWDYGDKRWHAFIIDMGKVSTQTIPLRHRHIPEDETEGYKEGTIYQHLAPEYILDRQPMSIQTDIFSVGKILSRIEGKVIKSRTLRDLAAEMTNINPRLRPSWKHIEKDIAKAQKKSLS